MVRLIWKLESGYGLNLETELRLLKMLRSISSIDNLPSLDLTWLGAHASSAREKHQYVFRGSTFKSTPSNYRARNSTQC